MQVRVLQQGAQAVPIDYAINDTYWVVSHIHYVLYGGSVYGVFAFVAGQVCRRAEVRHRFHQHLHSFASSVEHAVTAILLVLLGSVMPTLWQYLDWRHAIIGFGQILG